MFHVMITVVKYFRDLEKFIIKFLFKSFIYNTLQYFTSYYLETAEFFLKTFLFISI